MRTVIVYHKDGSKSVYDKGGYKRLDVMGLPIQERVMRGYYDLECSHKLAPGKNYNHIKQIWQRDIARREAGLTE